MCEHHNEHKSDHTGYHTGDKALPCKKCDKTSFNYLWIEHLYSLNFDIINSNFNIHVIIQITYNTLSCKECDVDLMYHLCHGEKISMSIISILIKIYGTRWDLGQSFSYIVCE